MDPRTIVRLRRNDALKKLPDGTEAVPVTLQYRGEMPVLPRAARKQWLQTRFAKIYPGVPLDLESVSPSGQTIQALCRVGDLGDIAAKVAANHDRIGIIEKQQAELGA